MKLIAKAKTRTMAGLLALLGATFPGAALAAECWAPNNDAARTGTGEALSQPRFARLVAALDKAEQMLREDPALAAIKGLRFQIRRTITYIDNARPTYTASILLTMHEPAVWGAKGCALDQGKADYLNNKGIEITFNQVEDIVSAISADLESGPYAAAVMSDDAAAEFRRSGMILGVGDGLRVLRPNGKPVLEPLSVSAHLANWEARLIKIAADGGADFANPEIAALRRHRANLTPPQLAAQVRLEGSEGEHMWSYQTRGDGAAFYMLAPDVLAPARDKTEVRIAGVKWFARDEDPMARTLANWVANLDAANVSDRFFGGQ